MDNDKLKTIKKYFLSGANYQKINFQELLTKVSWEEQARFLEFTTLHKLNEKYPLKIEYQIAFLKFIIRELENNEVDEIHDLIYEELARNLKEEPADFSFKHFIIDDDEDNVITIKESNSFIRDGTTGLKLWPAAIALGDFILDHESKFHGKSVLELGSGATGFVGFLAVKHCSPKKFYLSDCHDSVLQTLMENVGMNFPDSSHLDRTLNITQRLKHGNIELGIMNMPWEDVEQCENDLKMINPDILLAADVVYDDSIFDAFVQCLVKLFELFKDVKFYLSQTIRNEETFEKFCELLIKNNFIIINQEIIPKYFMHMKKPENDEEIKILEILKN